MIDANSLPLHQPFAPACTPTQDANDGLPDIPSRHGIARRSLLFARSAGDAVAAGATYVALRITVRTVSALFRAAMETIRAGYWTLSSRAAINWYHCRRFRRVTPMAWRTLRKMSSGPLHSVVRTGQSILKLRSAEQRAPLALDFLSLGSRAALGISFLLSVSDRLGLYGNPGERGVSWGTFERFLGYAAKVNSFAPAWMIPFLGATATVLEFLFGVTLVLGLAVRWAAFGSAGLLLLFGSAMAISFGIKSPFDYSVFAAMCCALFLGFAGSNRWTVDSLL